jgi:hypothetical protein
MVAGAADFVAGEEEDAPAVAGVIGVCLEGEEGFAVCASAAFLGVARAHAARIAAETVALTCLTSMEISPPRFSGRSRTPRRSRQNAMIT